MLPPMLVSTHNALLLCSGEDALIALHTGEGVYSGITWSSSELFVVARTHYPARVRRFDRSMGLLKSPPFVDMGMAGYIGPHQALWWDDCLYVTNTSNNRLEVWHMLSDTVSFVSWGGSIGVDVDHVNSIHRDAATGDLWVAEHRRQLNPKRFHRLYVGGSETFEVAVPVPVAALPYCGIHNLYIEDGYLYTLGPSELIILETDGTRAASIPLVEHGHLYLRGLAVDEEFFYIGASDIATRESRGNGNASILKVDRGSWQVEDELSLGPLGFGQVMEVRLLEGDRAHNGLPCPLLRGEM